MKQFETYDGLTESASRIGYYIQFDYRKDEIHCEIFIDSYPFEKYEGDFVSSNVYVYKGYEIYVHDILGGSISNIVSVVSMAHLGDYKMDINVSITNQDNYDCYREISLEFMFELIDNYVAKDN